LIEKHPIVEKSCTHLFLSKVHYHNLAHLDGLQRQEDLNTNFYFF
jgi:hypothetical protein